MKMKLFAIGFAVMMMCVVCAGAAHADPEEPSGSGVWVNWGGHWYDLHALYQEANNGSDAGWGGPDFSLTIDPTGIHFNSGSIIPGQAVFGSGFSIYSNNSTHYYGEAGASFELINNGGTFFLTESGQIPMSRTPEPLSMALMLIGLAGVGIAKLPRRK